VLPQSQTPISYLYLSLGIKVVFSMLGLKSHLKISVVEMGVFVVTSDDQALLPYKVFFFSPQSFLGCEVSYFYQYTPNNQLVTNTLLTTNSLPIHS
jgi:hypothetical protein